MKAIPLRQSGDSCVVSIPKTVTQSLGLNVGTKLDLTIEGNKIVLTPVSKKENYGVLTEEEKDWIDTHLLKR